MTRDEIQAIVATKVEGLFRVTFDDGAIQSVRIDSIDDEGILHSGPEGADPKSYWTGFKSVVKIESAE